MVKDGYSVTETLRPFGPAAGGVASFNRKDRGAFCIVILAVDQGNLFARKLKESVEVRLEVVG